MNKACGATVAICLLFSPSARAGQGEDVALDKLPPGVLERKFGFPPGTELLHARKEVEDGKEYYVVTVLHKGRQSEYFVSRDGRSDALKKTFSVAELPDTLLAYLLLGLLPGAIPGAAAALLARAVRGGRLSALVGWFAAWAGAAIGIGVCLS